MFIKKKLMYFKTGEGQGLVEYALILFLVALVVIVILGIFGQGLATFFSNIIESIDPLPTPVP